MREMIGRWPPLALVCVLAAGVGSLVILSPARAQSDINQNESVRPTSAIEGRVVLQSTHQPLAGVEVFVLSAFGVPPQRTDESGRFRFDHLSAGRYGLTLSPMSGVRARDTLVVLHGDESATGLEIKAYQAATVAGRVLDRRGRPVAGWMVSALRLHSAGIRSGPEGSFPSMTNDLGEYKVGGLNPGRYTLLVEAKRISIFQRSWSEDEPIPEGDANPSNVRTYYPNATALEMAGSFVIGAGQAMENLDVVVASERTYCVRSKVFNVAGGTVDRVHVTVSAEFFLGAAEVAEGDVSPGAGFEVCGLPSGSYRLLASPGGQSARASYASMPFSLTNRSLRLADLSLNPLVSLRGRLGIDAKDDVRSLSGPVTISLSGVGRPMLAGEQTATRVHDVGTFSIPAVLPDEYWLSVRVPEGFYVKGATMDGRDVLRAPLTAAGGELQVTIGQDGPKLIVLATDAQGKPFPGANVILGRDGLEASYAPDDLILALTDQNGQAILKGPAPAKYRLLVFGDAMLDPMSVGDFFIENRAKGELITLAPGENRTISLKVMDAGDGR